jgi:predicted XRE-type DNA-binding protein
VGRTNEATDVFQHIEMAGPDECWRWLGGWGGDRRDRRPYFMVDRRRYIAYRLVYELVTGNVLPSTTLLLHSCDNGGAPVGCCNPRHVREGTVKENADDMTARQRHGIPATQVQAIMRLISQGKKQQEIADLYGVSRETISGIATGRTYKHIGRPRREE